MPQEIAIWTKEWEKSEEMQGLVNQQPKPFATLSLATGKAWTKRAYSFSYDQSFV